MIIVCWLGFTNAWADEKASKNVLDKGIIFYGGIQVYQADGQFSYVKDDVPKIPSIFKWTSPKFPAVG